MTGRCVVLSAGPFKNADILKGYLLPDDYIIAADGGCRLAFAMGVSPSLLVADFDSISESAAIKDVAVTRLPIEKDVTDTAEAMRLGYESGYRSFLLLGCTGGRLDHFQAALAVAAQYVQRGCEVSLADEQNEIHLLTAGHYMYPVCNGEKLSVFAFGGDVVGLQLGGVKYPVEDLTLLPNDPLCVSNEGIDGSACISFKSGLLMLYFSRD